jgi:hypothetical protein
VFNALPTEVAGKGQTPTSETDFPDSKKRGTEYSIMKINKSCIFTVNQETCLYFLNAATEYVPRYVRIRSKDISHT